MLLLSEMLMLFLRLFLVNLWRRILFSGGVPDFPTGLHPTGPRPKPGRGQALHGRDKTRLVGQECQVGCIGVPGDPTEVVRGEANNEGRRNK